MGAEELDDCGMVLDFHDLDALMAESIGPFDHRHINEVEPFDELNPSAENLAMVIGRAIASRLPSARLSLVSCEVWENELSRARYIP